eukprot:3537261-Pyramimonas_sp.AAC.1
MDASQVRCRGPGAQSVTFMTSALPADNVHVDVVTSSGGIMQGKRHSKEVPRRSPGQPAPSP